MALAIMIAVILSLLTVIAVAFWRKQRTKKVLKLELEPQYEMDHDDDERENIVSIFEKIFPENFTV